MILKLCVMLKLLLEILLLIAAIIVFSLLSVVGIVYTFIKHIKRLDYSISKQLTPIVRSASLVIDCFANAAAGELLNDTLKVRGKIRYGKWYQTISAVSGLIHLYEKDTWFRRMLDKAFRGAHCNEAINEEERFYYDYHKNISG